MDNLIFRANYHNETIEAANSLYPFFKEYDVLPEKIEYVMSCIDTADTGSDYLAMITAAISEGYAYVLDIYYTKDPMEITEPEVARRLYEYKVNVAHIESNNGGRGFSRNVERLLYANHKSRNTLVKWFHQSQNKISRILSNATNVVNTLLFPKGWKQQYKESYEDLSVYQREGKNKNDDIEDVCTMLVEKLDKKGFRFL
jgi:predicted phage terminase large subunit-like protein